MERQCVGGTDALRGIVSDERENIIRKLHATRQLHIVIVGIKNREKAQRAVVVNGAHLVGHFNRTAKHQRERLWNWCGEQHLVACMNNTVISDHVVSSCSALEREHQSAGANIKSRCKMFRNARHSSGTCITRVTIFGIKTATPFVHNTCGEPIIHM